ncbi:MAG: hypothetical protein SGILL_008029 [Bacillariaceae sp.]
MSSSFAKQRLMTDWKELVQSQSSLTTVSAAPTANIFEWRANLRPAEGPFKGIVFQCIFEFTAAYPRDPPNIKLCTPLPHPNVFDNSNDDGTGWICLDMIKVYTSSTPYEGWTPAYSVTSILLQLQSFLFAENIPQDYGGHSQASEYQSGYEVAKAIKAAKAFTAKITTADGSEVVHSHTSPWPPLPQTKTAPQMSALTKRVKSAKITPKPASTLWSDQVPVSVLSSKIFSFLAPKDIITARNVCSAWRRAIVTHNVFERSQLSCFYTKKTLDDKGCILGVGISVEYHSNCSGLKSITSSLDVLSLEAFSEQHVRSSVFDKSSFASLLPLILNPGHAAKARPHAEKTIYEIMKRLPSPPYSNILRGPGASERLYPHMILQLLTTMMNSMVVQLMKDVDSTGQVRRHASEKALEGFCSFHHMLLYYSRVYPSIERMANKQVNDFIELDQARLKKATPDLGNLLVCLTLSSKGWHFLWKPFLLEMFDRNVRWLLRENPSLGFECGVDYRLTETFQGTKTSLRLLMFQVYFMSEIGRPAGSNGPTDVLKTYDQRLGCPTTKQKEDLQLACKRILAVNNWPEFFMRCGVPLLPQGKLAEILFQAVRNSAAKGYHGQQQQQQRSGGGPSRRNGNSGRNNNNRRGGHRGGPARRR